MCGSKPINLEVIANNDNSERINLQIIGGGHGCKGHEEKHDEHGDEDYHNAPDYDGMNPAYTLKGPFMELRYSAARNGDYSPMNSSIRNYSQEENSSYQKAA